MQTFEENQNPNLLNFQMLIWFIYIRNYVRVKDYPKRHKLQYRVWRRFWILGRSLGGSIFIALLPL